MRQNDIDRMNNKSGEPAINCKVGEYVYRISDLTDHRRSYGPCEICGEPCHATHMQVEGLIYKPGRMTYHNCFTHFGHKDCLLKIKK